jgi:hypothetical protein
MVDIERSPFDRFKIQAATNVPVLILRHALGERQRPPFFSDWLSGFAAALRPLGRDDAGNITLIE